MSKLPKWKTKKYVVTGWVSFATFLAVWAVDGILIWTGYPSISKYVTARAEDQPVFMWIVLGFLLWLAWHWFWRVIRK